MHWNNTVSTSPERWKCGPSLKQHWGSALPSSYMCDWAVRTDKAGRQDWESNYQHYIDIGGGPRVVVSTAALHARVRGSVPGLGGLKETKLFLPHPRVKVSIVGSLRDREVACSASDRQGSNFESCVWRTVSSQSSHQPQEVLLAQFSLYVHKGGLKPDSFHFYRHRPNIVFFFFFFFKIWYLAENKREKIVFPKYPLLREM